MNKLIVFCFSTMLVFSLFGLLNTFGFIIAIIFKIDNIDIAKILLVFMSYVPSYILKFISFLFNIKDPNISKFIFFILMPFYLYSVIFLYTIICIFPARKFYQELCAIIKNKTKPSLYFQVVLFILMFYLGIVLTISIDKMLDIVINGKFSKIYHLFYIFDFFFSAMIFDKVREKFLSKKSIFFQSLFAILVLAIVLIALVLIFFFPFAFFSIGNKLNFLMDKWIILYILCFVPIFILTNKTLKKCASF